MYARDFRKRAWQSLRGNWSIGILASLIYIGVGVVVANVPFGALVIAGPLSVGYVSVFLALARRENASLGRMLDGANDRQVNRFIVLPYIKPIIRISVIFAVTGSLKSFDLIYVLTNGGPRHATEVPSTLMINMLFLRITDHVGNVGNSQI